MCIVIYIDYLMLTVTSGSFIMTVLTLHMSKVMHKEVE